MGGRPEEEEVAATLHVGETGKSDGAGAGHSITNGLPVNSESERLSKQLLALCRAVDAQQPELHLSVHL